MIKSLYIKDFVIIKEQKILFDKGLNILTGETGAGKSIVIDAIKLLIGERASSDQVRANAKKSVIEGVFKFKDDNQIYRIIESYGFDTFDDEVILRKEISSKGGSRTFLNDTPIQISQLKEISVYFVDFHGQHDSIELFKSSKQLDVLDSYGAYTEHTNMYSKVYKEFKSSVDEYNSLLTREQAIKQKADFQKFQLAEIEKINPQENEDILLENELKILENSEILQNTTSQLMELLYEGDSSVYDKLSQAEHLFLGLNKIDDQFKEISSDLNTALINVKEISRFISDYAGTIEYNQDRIEEIRLRLMSLKGLTKKYGGLEQVISLKNSIIEELKLVENFDKEIENLKSRIASLSIELGITGNDLHKKRILAAEKLSQKVTELIRTLGMEKATFEIAVNLIPAKENDDFKAIVEDIEYKALSTGIDKITFMISTNNSESPKAINEIASGGELSRLILAIKSIYAKSEELPILIFDEIDTGISGRIAKKVGDLMKEISLEHQIISITHQPQIAALSDLHILIEKLEESGETIAKAKVLSQDEKLVEIAKMLSGENVTDASLASAGELFK